MKKMLVFFALTGIMLVTSCQEEEEIYNGQGWSDKLLVINEGPYQSGTGTITAYDRTTGLVTQDIYQLVNGKPLGNVVTSFTVQGDYAYIVVNNSNKIEVVNISSFVSAGTIEGLSFPAYMQGFDNSKGYVSCMDGTVKVVDLTTHTVTASIAAGAGPDKMLLAGDLWVLNGGGFASDSTVSIIDTSADTVKKTLIPGHVPSGIVKDVNGKVWILCSGNGWNGWPAATDSYGRLVCIDPADFSVIKSFDFPSKDIHPDNLVTNALGDILYYNHPAGIFEFTIHDAALPEEPLVKRNTMLYGMGYDPASNRLLGTDAMDYVQNGWVYFYDPSEGTPLDSFQTGVIPNGFWTGN